jgi:hypothetical protein
VTWAIPDWWTTALLALAAFRIWHLIGEDKILDRPRDWLLARLGDKTDALIACAWCSGWWASAALWLAWQAWPHWTLVACTPLAISALVGAIATVLGGE